MIVSSFRLIGFLSFFFLSLAFASEFADERWNNQRMVCMPGQNGGPGTIYGSGFVLEPLGGPNYETNVNNLRELLKNPAVLQTWGGSRTDTPEDLEKFNARLPKFLGREENNLPGWRPIYQFEEGQKGNFVGCMAAGYYPDNSIEIASCVKPEYWKRGYASRAGIALLGDLIRIRPGSYKHVWWSTLNENEGIKKISGTKLGLGSAQFDSRDSTLPDQYKRPGKTYFQVKNVWDFAQQIWTRSDELSTEPLGQIPVSGDQSLDTQFLRSIRQQASQFFFEAAPGGKHWSFKEMLEYVQSQPQTSDAPTEQ